MPVEIEQIREEHIDGFHAALDVVCRERVYLAFLEAPPIEATRTFVRANIARGAPHLVAVDEGCVVGWCDVLPDSRPTKRHGGVLGMGLLPQWRGRGVGAQILRQALAASRAFGLCRVELSVRHDNVRAQALYRQTGFEVEGRNRRALQVDGVFHDLVVMAVLLDEGR